jgi:class 3 adenylate cyclase
VQFRPKHKLIDNFLHETVHHTDTPYLQDYPTTRRTFAFIDVSNYSTYTQKHGTHAAAQMLHKFRNAVRIVVGRHGVRVAKWLGDGVLLVGVKTRPVFDAVHDLNILFHGQEFTIHSGIAHGEIIIFEGDDYVGQPINIAARLSDYARPSEILAHNIRRVDLPPGVSMKKLDNGINVRGIGELTNVFSLMPK